MTPTHPNRGVWYHLDPHRTHEEGDVYFDKGGGGGWLQTQYLTKTTKILKSFWTKNKLCKTTSFNLFYFEKYDWEYKKHNLMKILQNSWFESSLLPLYRYLWCQMLIVISNRLMWYIKPPFITSCCMVNSKLNLQIAKTKRGNDKVYVCQLCKSCF